jgi:hypothetical protein
MATKKGIGMTTNFFQPSLLLMFLDPGSEIWNPGWIKIRIRDPGSATRETRTGPEKRKIKMRKKSEG